MEYMGRKTAFEFRDDKSTEMTRGLNYLKIWDFMLGDFKLANTELLVYAMIFTMHINYVAYYSGSRKLMQSWTNVSKKTIDRALDSLLKKNLILRYYEQDGKIKRTVYHINPDALPTCDKFAPENRNRNRNRNLYEKIKEHERRCAAGLE